MRVLPRYTDEFKSDAVDLLERSGRSLPAVARDLGVSVGSLRTWYKDAVMAKKKRPKAPGAASLPPAAESADDENRRLKSELATAKRRIDELEEDRAILKKAAAFFAKESE